MNGRPYDGPGARGADLLAGRLADTGDALVFELQADALDAIVAEHEEPGFHAQYAFCFTAPAGERCLRATYRGAGMGEDGWSFQRHVKSSDTWLAAAGLAAQAGPPAVTQDVGQDAPDAAGAQRQAPAPALAGWLAGLAVAALARRREASAPDVRT